MSFVDELHREATVQQKKHDEERLARDSKLLNSVIQTVKDTCHDKIRHGKEHKINGFYYFCDGDGAFREDISKSQIPVCFSISAHYGDRTRWCSAYTIDDPTVFESSLNDELTKLGFYSMLSPLSMLIPRKNQEYIGTSTFGSPKYKLTGTTSYTIWISVSW